jgi:hypothetical protein
MIADKNYYGREFEATLHQAGLELCLPELRPASTQQSPASSCSSAANSALSSPIRRLVSRVSSWSTTAMS